MEVTVKFEKRFTAGILEGLTYNGKLSFVNRESANRWMAAVSGKDIKTGGDTYHYTVFTVGGELISTNRRKI